MNRFFYTKLAFSNIKNNKRMYVPYILACVGTIQMFYLIYALAVDKAFSNMYGGQYVQSYMMIGSVVIAIFAFIFLFYTNNFLIRNRKKELAMFNILGMEKKHIGIIMLLETIIIAFITLIAGIALGILFSKLALLLLLKILRFDVQFGFSVQIKSIVCTVILFTIIFSLSMLNNLRQVHFTNPIELLSSDKQGEREPKSRVILAILGFVSLGTGYYLAVVTKNPISAIGVFFLAVVLVIIGTLLLFMTGSILILKIMRKNKGYYYKTKHFINVSGMIYRMKQNSAGLSNICILSTMVLVTLSTTIALYVGIDDIASMQCPNDISIEVRIEDEEANTADKYIANLINVVDKELKVYESNITNKFNYNYLNVTFSGRENKFVTVNKDDAYNDEINDFYIITVDDYNKIYNENIALNGNEIIFGDNKNSFSYDNIIIGNNEYKVAGRCTHEFPNVSGAFNLTKNYYMVVDSISTIDKLYEEFNKTSDTNRYDADMMFYQGIDLNISSESEIKLLEDIKSEIYKDDNISCYIAGKENAKNEVYSVYGGLLFLGIFCGILFIMATVLIMYYKQISEGFDDKRRFDIMQQVGMSKKEIKNSIHSQVLTVFFLPLIVAGIHTAFAFPLISKILALMSLRNTNLFVMSTICTFLIFGIFYIIVYSLTAKTYYKIVK